MTKTIRLTQTLTHEYQQLFASCRVRPEHRAAVERLTQQVLKQQPRYLKVAQATQIPWAVIAVIHAMESSQRFDRHLHNGDPLHSRTVRVPADRPLSSPPFTWETSAIDALQYSGLAQWRDWSIAGTLFKLEAYNGWGYRRYHTQVLSPYLWSFSEHYQRGKYAADGRFDSQLVSQQCGAALLLKQLNIFSDPPTTGATHSVLHRTRAYPGRLLKLSRQQRLEVQQIQRQLNALGYQPTLAVDGYFGSNTQEAVRRFQASSHLSGVLLKVDGIVGKKTWAALFK